MMSSSVQRVLLALLLVPLLVAAQQNPPRQNSEQQKQGLVPWATERIADSYAVYSLLLNEHPFDALPSNQTAKLAIADTTVSLREMNPSVSPDSELQPPEDNADAFKEAVRDFDSRRYQRVQLTRRFSLNTDYTLLNSGQVNEFRTARAGTSPGSELQDAYAGYPGITFFSEVYFNQPRTVALVYRNNWCASPCATGEWFYLEKRGTEWVRRSGSVPHP